MRRNDGIGRRRVARNDPAKTCGYVDVGWAARRHRQGSDIAHCRWGGEPHIDRRNSIAASTRICSTVAAALTPVANGDLGFVGSGVGCVAESIGIDDARAAVGRRAGDRDTEDIHRTPQGYVLGDC